MSTTNQLVSTRAWATTKQNNMTVLLIVMVFLLVRLPSLLSIPLFNDEAVYLLRALRFPTLLRDTLEEGKFLQELLLAAAVRLPFEPLVLGRLLSVASGLVAVFALIHAGRVLQSSRAGYIAALLYATAPLVTLHDLLAIPDSLLTCVSIFFIIASFRYCTSENGSRREAALLGLLLGVVTLVKLPGAFLFCVPVLGVLLLQPRAQWRSRLAQLRTTLLVLLACLVLVSPWHYGGNEADKVGAHTAGERIERLAQNAEMIGQSLAAYLPAPLLISLLLIGAARRKQAMNTTALWLAASGIAFIVAFLVVGSTMYPRYLLPAFPLLLLAVGLSVDRAWERGNNMQRGLVSAPLALALCWNSYFAYELWHNPLHAPLVQSDKTAYLGGWTAGYGIADMHNWLLNQARNSAPITVALHDQPRLVQLSADLRFRGEAGVELAKVDLRKDAAIAQLDALAQHQHVFIPLDEEERIAFHFDARFPHAIVKWQYNNPLGTMRFYVYEYTR